MAKKGDLRAVTHLCVGLDAALAHALEHSAEKHERNCNQEVRYQLRLAYGINLTPAEVTADVAG